MTTQAAATPHVPATATEASLSQRLLALSGVAFAPFFIVGWLGSAGTTPHYTAPAQDWTNWAHDNQWKGRISSFALLFAAFLFLYFLAAIRTTLVKAEAADSRSAHLATAALGGGLVGMAGLAMGFVTLDAASSEGARAEAAVSRAVTTSVTGPFLVGTMALAAFLLAAGLLTLRSGVLARWTGIVALIGSISFLLLSFTVLDGTGDGSNIGYAFFPAMLSLLIWTVTASLARYRAVAGAPPPVSTT